MYMKITEPISKLSCDINSVGGKFILKKYIVKYLKKSGFGMSESEEEAPKEASADTMLFNENIPTFDCGLFKDKLIENDVLERLVIKSHKTTNKLFINNLDGQSELIGGKILEQRLSATVVEFSRIGDLYNPVMAVKFSSKTRALKEKKILDMLKRESRVVPCGLVNYRYLGQIGTKMNNWAIARELMDGNLSTKRHQIQWNTFLGIMRSILSQLKCLKNNHLYLTNLRMENIFYKCVGKNLYKIHIGNLDSIYSSKKGIIHPDKKIEYSYKPKDYSDDIEYPVDKFVVYSIGAIMTLLITIYGRYMTLSEKVQKNVFNVPKHIDLVRIINKATEDRHKRRFSLEQLMTSLEEGLSVLELEPEEPPASPPPPPPAATAPLTPENIFNGDVPTHECNKFSKKEKNVLKRLVVEKRNRYLNDLSIINHDGSRSKLIAGKILGQGNFGKVVGFSREDDLDNPLVAIKFATRTDTFKEKNILEMLKRGSRVLPCGLVNYRYLGQIGTEVDNWAIACDLMDGDLSYLYHKTQKIQWNTFIGIMTSVLSQLKCLKNNHLYYTDLKITNVFYKCVGKNSHKIYLGDLGSIFVDLSFKGLTRRGRGMTFSLRPKDFIYHRTYPIDKFVVYSVGVFMLHLLGISDENDITTIKEQIPRNIDNVPKHVDLVSIINSAIEERFDKRCSLEQLIFSFIV